MTGFEWLLAPIAIGITLLLLQASFCRSNNLSLALAIVALSVSYYFSTNYFEQLVITASLAVILFAFLREGAKEEFKILILLSTMGALTCINSHNFMKLFVGIELLTLPLYGLIAWDKNNSKNIQAGIKYLVLAGASSAFLLLGMAFLYAESGSMALKLGSLKGSVLLFVGLGFKLSLVPFHLWTGDIYEDTPLPVTGFLATVSKIAVVGVLVNFTPNKSITTILSIIAILSMITGSLLTLRQQNISRFLGYSSISHMGYILVAWLIGANVGFYMTAYTITLLAAFWMLSWQPESKIGSAVLALSFLSLMGLPMLPIFWGKYQILISAFGSGHWTLFGVFIFSSLLGVFGYARLITKICLRSVQA
jgi:NADH-quinone oxidoreductase subunit N